MHFYMNQLKVSSFVYIWKLNYSTCKFAHVVKSKSNTHAQTFIICLIFIWEFLLFILLYINWWISKRVGCINSLCWARYLPYGIIKSDFDGVTVPGIERTLCFFEMCHFSASFWRDKCKIVTRHDCEACLT